MLIKRTGLNNMKLKDFKFKCTRLSMRDFNGYSHVMELYDLYGNYIHALKYDCKEDPEAHDSKQSTKKQLVKYIKENEKVIYDYILARRRKDLGIK